MRFVSWKSGNAIAVCVMAFMIGQFAAAQELQQAEQPAQTAQTPQPAQAAQKPAEKQPPQQISPMLPPAVSGGPNIRFQITITDQAGEAPPVKKTLNVIAADGYTGSVRSKVTVAVPMHPPGPDPKNYSYESLPLNIDVKPEITKNGLVRTQLSLNYETFYAAKAAGMPAVRSVVTAIQWVMLENGKPMTVSQSADAATDRQVTVELTATILR
jgi:hypothetical protein